MTVRRSRRPAAKRKAERFRCLIELDPGPTLEALAKRLEAVPCRHRVDKVPRSTAVRLMVAARDFDFAFRVYLEFTASEVALRKPAAAQATERIQ